tara:strand:- start:956 stop:1471 length:516 start_codon:yes stop_codon:yes gene_type:complete
MLIVDNFYSPFDFSDIIRFIKESKFTPTMQPKNINYDNRLKGYPCYESIPTDRIKEITLRSLREKTPYKFKNLKTEFRKIFAKELLQSPLANQKEGILHKDDEHAYAGVIYFDGLTIKGGTSLFFTDDQIEPDIIYAARPNRLILHKSDIMHCANYDYCYKERTIQTIFLQ